MTSYAERVHEIVEHVDKSFAECEPLEKGELYGCKVNVDEVDIRNNIVEKLIRRGYSVSHEMYIGYKSEGANCPSAIHELTIYKLG